jgi:3',5'-cyclic AMP phosphodiesterase CpdA
MSIKRRQFLLLASLSTFATGFLTNMGHQNAQTIKKKTPKPAQDLWLRFVSVADTGTGTKSQYAVAQAMANYHSRNPYKLAILAGDNIYNNGEMEKIGAVFERPYAPLIKAGVKFQAALGNHDIRTLNGELQLKYPGFNMQGRYYTFRRNNVQFFALDTNTNADWNSQLAWLKQQLSQSNAPWKIVFGHHPVYASGVYGNNPAFIKTLTPIFQKYGVQLYINGHEHHYERTRSINGTTYLICGGGAGTRPVGRSQVTEYSASKLSFAAYDVFADRIEIKGIDTKNKIFDRGIIRKTA